MTEKFDLAEHRRLWTAMALNVDYAITQGWAAARFKDFILAVEFSLFGDERPYEDEFACDYRERAVEEEEFTCEGCPLAWGQHPVSAKEWACFGGLQQEFNLALFRKESAKAKRLALTIARLPVRKGGAV